MQNNSAFIFTNTFVKHPDNFFFNNAIKIAVDKGANYLEKNNIVPDIVIGDMDSVSPLVKKKMEKQSKIIEFFPEKDESDTELAIKWCYENSIKKIVIFNSLEKKIDHSLGIVSNLFFAHSLGIKSKIVSHLQEVYPLNRHFSYSGEIGDILSILPFGVDLCGVKTDGLFYELKGENLSYIKTKGISNILEKNEISISVKSGHGIIVITKKRGFKG